MLQRIYIISRIRTSHILAYSCLIHSSSKRKHSIDHELTLHLFKNNLCTMGLYFMSWPFLASSSISLGLFATWDVYTSKTNVDTETDRKMTLQYSNVCIILGPNCYTSVNS